MLAHLLIAAALVQGPNAADTTLRLARGSSVEIDSQNKSILLHVSQSDVVSVKGAGAADSRNGFGQRQTHRRERLRGRGRIEESLAGREAQGSLNSPLSSASPEDSR